jgi:hypothetical protein
MKSTSRSWFSALLFLAAGVGILYYRALRGNHISEITSESPRALPMLHEREANGDDDWTNAEVILPFLGAIPCRTRLQTTEVNTREGKSRSMTFQVFEDGAGRFLRATFFQESARNFEKSPQQQELGMSVSSEKVVGLAKEQASVSWQDIVNILAEQVQMEKVTQMSITFVEYSIADEEAPMFLIHVMGAMTPSEKLPDTPENLRIRYLANSKGELFRFDNNL